MGRAQGRQGREEEATAAWTDAAAVARRRDQSRPTATVRVGVLVNGRADGGRAEQLRALAGVLPDGGAGATFAATRSLDELPSAVGRLLVHGGVNVLALVGGDGTVHHAVNALLALEAASAACHGPTPLPRLLLLGGGTLNIVARTTGVHGRPRRRLRHFLRYFDGTPLSRVPARRLDTMTVRSPGTPDRHGFVFGSEVLHHAIALYVRFGAGYGGLGRFLFELARGATLGSALWREESWRLGPFGSVLEVDGRRFEPYTAVVASSVDLTLAVGGVRAIRRPLHAPGFFTKVVLEHEPMRVLQMVPALMREARHPGVVDLPEAMRMRLAGPYTLDGELFGHAERAGPRAPLDVAEGPRVYAVPGELGAMRW